MLILILIDVQYLQNVVFNFEKGLNGQNYSSSDFHRHIKIPHSLISGHTFKTQLLCTKNVSCQIAMGSQYASCTKLLNSMKQRCLVVGRLLFQVQPLAKKSSLMKRIQYDYLSQFRDMSGEFLQKLGHNNS